MRKILPLIFLFISLHAFGQQPFPMGNGTSKTYARGMLTADSIMQMPTRKVLSPYFSNTGNFAFVNDTFQIYNGTSWITVSGSGGGSIDTGAVISIIADSTQEVREAINDTAAAIRADFFPIGGGTFSGDVDLGNNSLTGIPTPVNAGDAVPYDFLQQFTSGFIWKKSVLATTATELPAFSYGGSNNIIFNAVGACPVVDGKTLHVGSRILNKNSKGADTVYNGIFTVTTLGDGSTQCVFTRSADANTELTLNRATVSTDSGDANMGIVFTEITPITTINVSPVTFQVVPLASVKAGFALYFIGNVLNADTTILAQVKDSATGTSVLAKKYITPYNFYQRLNAGIELTNSQWSWLDGSGNQRMIFSNSGIVVQDALGSTGTELKTTRVSFNQPTGNGNLQPWTLTGSWTWRIQNKSYTFADSAVVAGKQDAGNYITALTGDGTAAGPSAAVFTLANSGVNSGTYGGASAIPVITVDSKGRATTITTVAPVTSSGTVTSVSVTSANGFAGVVANATTTPAITLTTTVNAMVKANGTALLPAVAGTDYQSPGNYITALTGDVTATGPNSAAATLANSGVTSGTYGSATAHAVITVDAKGRATTITTVSPSVGTVTGTLPIANGGTGATSFTTGSVPFMGSTTFSENNSSFFWDNTNSRLGVGTNGPICALEVVGAASSTMANFRQSWSGTGSPVGFIIAVSDASSGTGKLFSARAGSSGATERFYIDKGGNAFSQISFSTPNLWSTALTTTLALRNQSGNVATTNADGISAFADRAGTNQLSFIASSGQTNAFAIYPRYNQTSSSASNTDLLVNRTQTAVGSGTQRLFDLQVGSTTMHNVSNAGVMYNSGAVLIGSTTNDGVNALQVTGSTTTNRLTVNTGVSQGSGIKHIRQTTGSISAGSSSLITVTWASAFADASYTVNASVLDGTASTSALRVVHIESQTASTLTVRVENTSVGSLTGTLNLIAIHD